MLEVIYHLIVFFSVTVIMEDPLAKSEIKSEIVEISDGELDVSNPKVKRK